MARPSVAPPASTRSALGAGGSPAAPDPHSRFLPAAEIEWNAMTLADFVETPLFCRWIQERMQAPARVARRHG